MKKVVHRLGQRLRSASLPRWWPGRWQASSPAKTPALRFGSLRRTTPISVRFGYDRGQPIDRYYIENFLARSAADIAGRVLEIGDDSYTRRFGGERVRRSDVLHVSEGNPRATLVGDLARGEGIPSEAFDCLILTQTLHLIYDVPAALRTIHRVLRPGGVLLATFPGISQIDPGDWGDTWYWGFSPRSSRRLFAENFGGGEVTIAAHGNLLATCAFLHGLAAAELTREELDFQDPAIPFLLTVRAVKQPGVHQAGPAVGEGQAADA